MSRSSPWTFSRFLTNKPDDLVVVLADEFLLVARGERGVGVGQQPPAARSISPCCASENATMPMVRPVSRRRSSRTSCAMYAASPGFVRCEYGDPSMRWRLIGRGQQRVDAGETGILADQPRQLRPVTRIARQRLGAADAVRDRREPALVERRVAER